MLSMYILWQKIWCGNVSSVFEVTVPQLVLKANVDGNNVVLDWSGYDISDKYFVIYRKSEISDNFETIVGLGRRFRASSYIDTERLDVTSPDNLNIDIQPNSSNNDISLSFTANDNCNKYVYYVEAYDSKNTSLALGVSNCTN